MQFLEKYEFQEKRIPLKPVDLWVMWCLRCSRECFLIGYMWLPRDTPSSRTAVRLIFPVFPAQVICIYTLYIYIIYIQVICTYDGIRDSNHSVAPIVFQIENIFAKLECMENILLNWNAWKIFSLNWNAYKIFSQNWNVCTFGFFGQKHLVFGSKWKGFLL